MDCESGIFRKGASPIEMTRVDGVEMCGKRGGKVFLE